jgi:cytochrome c oxidase subunit 3
MNKNSQMHEEKMFQNSVAMTVTLISFGMLFATMFLGFFLVRFSTAVWPPIEIQGLPTLLPLLSTIVMGLSSYTYWRLEKKENDRKLFWKLTFFLGVIFLVLQWVLWQTMTARGILVSNGHVPSMVIAFTWIHAAHILMALGALLWLGRFIFKKKEELTEIKLVNVGKFWHFLGIVWLLMYLLMFVL